MRPDTHNTYHERILRTLIHIQHHLDEALDLDALARVAHFSPYHFHRIFRGMVGESVQAHSGERSFPLYMPRHRLFIMALGTSGAFRCTAAPAATVGFSRPVLATSFSWWGRVPQY